MADGAAGVAGGNRQPPLDSTQSTGGSRRKAEKDFDVSGALKKLIGAVALLAGLALATYGVAIALGYVAAPVVFNALVTPVAGYIGAKAAALLVPVTFTVTGVSVSALSWRKLNSL